jgi:hypothetical protein
MAFPAECDKDINIEQEGGHSISDSSSLTRSEVML